MLIIAVNDLDLAIGVLAGIALVGLATSAEANINVWTSAGDGVHVLTPVGDLLGKIRIPQPVANLTFGGPRRSRLFITATRSVYALHVAAGGIQRP